MNPEFTLAKGEKVIKEFKPSKKFKRYWTFGWIFGCVIGIIIILILFVVITTNISAEDPEAELDFLLTRIIGSVLFGFCILLSLLSYPLACLRYKWEYYWITNKRIVRRAGLIGYHHYFVPFERISDMIIKRDFLEKWLHIGSIHIQSFAGQRTIRGAELIFRSLENPEEIQKMLFELAEEKRKREKLAF